MEHGLVYKLDGLCCPNCAMKIENKVNNLDEIEEASVNFALQTLTIHKHDNIDIGTVKDKLIKIVKQIEPDVLVVEQNQSNTKGKHKITKKVTNHIPNGTLQITKQHDHGDLEQQMSKNLGNSIHGEKQLHGHDHSHQHGGSNQKSLLGNKELYQFAFAAVIYMIPFFLELPSIIELPLYFIAYLISGGEVLLRSLKNIRKGDVFDENFLMSVATIGAFAIGNYPEGVAVMLFYQVGELFQDYAVSKSRNSITELMDIRPDVANLMIGNEIKVVTPEEVSFGDTIVVRPGEKVPLDGTVISGNSMVDTSALTGESVPREVLKGDNVLSGFINKNGVLTIRVEKEFHESTISKILELVENASSRKAATEKFITKFARVYTPIVTIAALLLAIVPPIIISGATFSQWLYRALVFLVISCPCALVVSIPLGFFGGIGGASKLGVLVKGSNYLEILNEVKVVVFDKTGTLTKGIFEVSEVVGMNGYKAEDIIHYAAHGEQYSTHPIGEAIRRKYFAENNGRDTSIEEYEEIAGKGIKAVIDGKEVYLGNKKLMNDLAIETENVGYGTIIHVVIQQVYAGYILISDEVKEDAKSTITQLKNLGKDVVMLTGDNEQVGEAVGKSLGIDRIYTDLLPQDKVEHVEQLIKECGKKDKVMFVGDGINDAPVLALSHIGVAMGGLGSDAAIEAADVVLMTDEPSKLISGFAVAKKTNRIVWQNIIMALAIKGLFLILGAFGVASMWEAVFADVGVALLAVLNAMRVMKVKE